jgi:hypothetical protein
MVSRSRLPQQISRSATPLDGPGLVTATVLPAEILAPSMDSFVPLMIPTATREPFPTTDSFMSTLLRKLAPLITSALRTALLA